MMLIVDYIYMMQDARNTFTHVRFEYMVHQVGWEYGSYTLHFE